MVRYYDDEAALYTYASLVLSPEYDFPKFVPLCTEDALQQLNPKVQLSQLYDLVWKPLEPFLKKTKTIFYAPTGLLDQVPFHALYKGIEEDEVLAVNASGRRGVVEGGVSLETSENVSYLLDQFTLHQLTSTRNLLLDSLQKRKNTLESNIVLLGGCDYDAIGNEESSTEKRRRTKGTTSRSAAMGGNALHYLPGTLEEVQNIHKNLCSKNWKSTCFVGEKASESALTEISRDTNVRFWHIATHGFAFQQAKKGTNQTTGPLFRSHPNPMVRCGLVLAGGTWAWIGNDTLSRIGWKENGILTALEVSQLDLSHLDLVVLSACETGLGKVEGAEGTFGLKRGFKMAGVKEIIISLWAVPDKETMELMQVFYAGLVSDSSVDAAFETALKTMRKRYPTKPELWAGFVLVR
jgi:CHAT domain-containing protein